jgi:hypothetical protein
MIATASELPVAVGSTSGGPIFDALARRTDEAPVFVVTDCGGGMTTRGAIDQLRRSGAVMRVIDAPRLRLRRLR